jgi:hypothetical protein
MSFQKFLHYRPVEFYGQFITSNTNLALNLSLYIDSHKDLFVLAKFFKVNTLSQILKMITQPKMKILI